MADIDWTKSMQQTYKFYKVDTTTWFDDKEIDLFRSCNITRDSSTETKTSATIDADSLIEDEFYVRVYLIAIQNGYTYKEPLGTFLIQTPSESFDGKKSSYSIDAYSPLLELKEDYPPIGYTVMAGTNIMDSAVNNTEEHLRAPVIAGTDDTVVPTDTYYTANTSDTWLTYNADLLTNIGYSYGVTPLGKIIFQPDQDTASLQPKWEYNDDNSSILYPEITKERDLYGIPNVVEVVVSTSTKYYVATATNNDSNSPTSIQQRGRRIVYREINPDGMTLATNQQLDDYATKLLRSKSSIEYSISYTHGYCPVDVGDCVRLNYERAGIKNVKAKVTKQSIKCETGCSVSETAVFTKNLWEG
jgi:hypothetical protein